MPTRKYQLGAGDLIVNSPFTEPAAYWSYDRQARVFTKLEGRRSAGYVVATPDAQGFDDPGRFIEIALVNRIRPRVKAWREANYPGITGATRRLLEHWCDAEQREGRRFFFCQLEAIETLMNFMLRHSPVLTYDVDLWIEDTAENRRRCAAALAELNAEWGARDDDWAPVADLPADWLMRQPVFCLTSSAGAIDIFRSVTGLADWRVSFAESVEERTSGGIDYRGLSDADMLRCQYALSEPHRKLQRIAVLEAALKAAQQ